MEIDLTELFQDLWKSLTTIPGQPGHPWRTPAMGSVSLEGLPSVRTVVLRKVLPEQGILIAHTDVRSPKVAEVTRNASTEWMFYDATPQVQLRMRGTTEVICSGHEFETGWEETPKFSRLNYQFPKPPGEPLVGEEFHSSRPGESGNRCLSSEHRNFCLLKTTVDCVDWLQLRQEGHLRACWHREVAGWSGLWIAP